MFPRRGNLKMLVSLKINFLFNLLEKERNRVVCVGAPETLNRLLLQQRKQQAPAAMAALMLEFSFVWLHLEDDVTLGTPK